MPNDLPPSTRNPRSPEDAADSMRISILPINDSDRVKVPDLDESPRTIRHAIVSDDED
jgi:hypothetical protein